jgi:SAM-dependent methyltransferase
MPNFCDAYIWPVIDFANNTAAFLQALHAVDLNTIEALPYPLEYANYFLQHKEYFTNIYAKCLQQVYTNQSSLEKDTIVDFGCGSGFLALFIAFCGGKNVVAVELREEFIVVAKQLQQQLQLNNITWLVGNEQMLTNYFKDKPKPTTLIATDVIEHVYNLNQFFSCLREMQLQNLVFTTGSVHDNFFKRRQLYKLMYKDENSSNTPLHVSINSKYGSMPYVQVRALLIKELYPKLEDKICQQLAKNTRGLNKPDIIKAVDKYLYTQQLPKPIAHKYNTCDPITGSFTERMLTTKEYKTLFTQHGYKLEIINGSYNDFGDGLKKILLKLLNTFILFFSKSYVGRCISPSIFLVAKPIQKIFP